MRFHRPVPVALTVSAFLAAPTLALAQEGEADPQHEHRQEEQRQRQRQQQEQQRQQQQRQQEQQRGAQRVQQQFSFPVADECTYTVQVDGTVTPAAERPEPGQPGQPGAQPGQPGAQPGQELVTPNLNISAVMACPGAAEVRINENVTTPQPIPRAQLTEMIERRATIATTTADRMCLYVPDFEVEAGQLTARSIAFMCRVPAQPGMQPGQPGMPPAQPGMQRGGMGR